MGDGLSYNKMLKRIITGIFVGIGLFLVCYFSDTVYFALVFAILSAVGVYEMLGCIGYRNRISVSAVSILLGFLAPLFAKIDKDPFHYVCYLLSLSFLYLLYIFALSVFSKGKFPIDGAFAVFSTSFYIAVSFTSVVLLRGRDFGSYLILIAIFAPLISDVFAYFCGVFFGKHKLIPDVSPKKTVEGSVGGMFFCGVSCALFGIVIAKTANNEVGVMLAFRMFAIGVIVSVISQLGDLIASVIKRKYGIKDYGVIFPGHGGVLDRFDSVLSTAPVILMLTLFPEFVSLAA